jgi:hypothetical protein
LFFGSLEVAVSKGEEKKKQAGEKGKEKMMSDGKKRFRGVVNVGQTQGGCVSGDEREYQKGEFVRV